MTLRFSFSVAAFCIAGISLLGLNSCKEDTILDANIVPVGDTANIIVLDDTLTILSRTVLDDSFATSLSVSGIPIYHAVGRLTSDINYSGDINASMYLQVIPPSTGFKFPKAPDSAILILPYAGFTWGDTTVNTQQTLRVYEVTDPLSKDSVYYNFTDKGVDRSTELGNAMISYNTIKDSIMVDGVERFPHVRIKLSDAFLKNIKDEETNGTALNAASDFVNFFKGIYVESDAAAGNALYYFMLNGSTDFTRANIQFFYTDKTANNVDTVRYSSFYFDQTVAAHYNKIQRNLAGTFTGSKINSPNNSDSIFILQNEPGAALDIRLPFVKHLPKLPILKAELVITQYKGLMDNEDKFWEPERLFPVGVYTGGGTYTIQDRFPVSSVEPLVFMDGRRRDVTINGMTVSQYVINIPRELQKAIVEQRDTLHLRINGATQYPGAYRLIGGGRDMSGPNSPFRIKLNVIYSKI